MFAFFLGIAAGSFIAAFVNYKYSTSNWIKTKYLVWIGIIALAVSIVFGWSDIQEGFGDSTEVGNEITAQMQSLDRKDVVHLFW